MIPDFGTAKLRDFATATERDGNPGTAAQAAEPPVANIGSSRSAIRPCVFGSLQ